VGLQIGEVADVVGTGDRAVIAIGDPGVEPRPRKRLAERARASGQLAIGDPRAGA